MSGDDRVRWDARHAAAGPPGVTPPGVLAGAAELTACFPVSGRALDVACGRGGVAVWLARRGLAVDAVDVSPVGLAAGARLAAAAGVTGRIRWIADRQAFHAAGRRNQQPPPIWRPVHGLGVTRDLGRQARLAAIKRQDPGPLPTAAI